MIVDRFLRGQIRRENERKSFSIIYYKSIIINNNQTFQSIIFHLPAISRSVRSRSRSIRVARISAKLHSHKDDLITCANWISPFCTDLLSFCSASLRSKVLPLERESVHEEMLPRSMIPIPLCDILIFLHYFLRKRYGREFAIDRDGVIYVRAA